MMCSMSVGMMRRVMMMVLFLVMRMMMLFLHLDIDSCRLGLSRRLLILHGLGILGLGKGMLLVHRGWVNLTTIQSRIVSAACHLILLIWVHLGLLT